MILSQSDTGQSDVSPRLASVTLTLINISRQCLLTKVITRTENSTHTYRDWLQFAFEVIDVGVQ